MSGFIRRVLGCAAAAPGEPTGLEDSDGSETALEGEADQELEDTDVGTDAICKSWFWGHADSEREPPGSVPSHLGVVTTPLRLGHEAAKGAFYQQFAQYVLCPHFLDKQAQGSRPGEGCPFLGGTAYLRHADVSRLLAQVPTEHASGQISRGNELGYLLLKNDAFPSVNGEPGTLGLGNSVEDHRVQRRWFEQLLHPSRIPSRAKLIDEVKELLADRAVKRRFKVRSDIAKWWQQMLWKHVLGVRLSWEEARAYVKFQSQWLQSAILPGPAAFVDYLPSWVSNGKAVWGLEKLMKQLCEYREKVKAALPSDVPDSERELVAQGILEMFTFAGGLSVPQTINCALAVLYTNGLMPSPVTISEANIEAFIYEVLRLFPPVQGFCFWRNGKREVLSLNAALRDPAVWGQDTANRFSLKDLDLYRRHFIGFANPAVSEVGTFDSKACPGIQFALDAMQAFVLAVSSWQPAEMSNKQLGTQPHVFWSFVRPPKAQGVHKKWFSDFTLEVQDWLDGDQTGEALLRNLGPIDCARLLHKIGLADAQDSTLGSLLGKMGPKSDRQAGAKLVICDAATRLFYEVSRKRFKELEDRAGSTTQASCWRHSEEEN